MSVLEWVRSNLKASHRCDSYVEVRYPASHPRYWFGKYMRSYWIRQYGFSRGIDMKGIAVISVVSAPCMNELLDLQHKLQETHAALVQLEREIAKEPRSRSLEITTRSLEKRYRQLEAEFLAAANRLEIDVCGYRLFAEEDRPTLAAMASALSNLQLLFSVVFDALKSGPKQTLKLGADVYRETAFGFGYSFPGCVGFAFTIPNERLLLVQSNLDEAMRIIFEMARVEEPSSILGFARRLGVAPIRAMYRWVSDHLSAGMGAGIEWRREQQIRASLLIQTPELRRLQSAIAATSEEIVQEIEISGILVGADVARRTFHLKTETGDDVRGAFIDAIGDEHTVELPKPYRIRVRKTSKIYYSTEREDVTYVLLGLEPI